MACSEKPFHAFDIVAVSLTAPSSVPSFLSLSPEPKYYQTSKATAGIVLVSLMNCHFSNTNTLAKPS